VRAEPLPDPPAPRAVVVAMPPAADAGAQLRPMPPAASKVVRPASAAQVVAEANHKASAAPDRGDYFNAIVRYAYEPGTLYQVFAAPMHVTDVVLEPGERISGQPATGDSVRWVLAVGQSMDHGQPQSHVYVKPTRADLQTNLAINTDRRTYLLELRSYDETYMAAVTWHYPQDELARLQLQADAAAALERSTAPVVSLDALNFNYTIHVEHGSPVWTPLQVFDDGRKTFIRFPPAMLVRDAPALFVLRDNETQLVNYRVKGDTYVVDRLIESAELRVGQQDQEIVRIGRAGKR
jgi:type IV secretion system protein VirB9